MEVGHDHFPIFKLPNEMNRKVFSKLKMKDRLNLRLVSRYLAAFLTDTNVVPKCEIDQTIIFFSSPNANPDHTPVCDYEILSIGMPKISREIVSKMKCRDNNRDVIAQYPIERDLLEETFSKLPGSLKSLRFRALKAQRLNSILLFQTSQKELCAELEKRKFRIEHVLLEGPEIFMFIPLLRTMLRLGCNHYDMNLLESMEVSYFNTDPWKFREWKDKPITEREDREVMKWRCTQEADMSKEEFFSMIQRWYSGEIMMCKIEFSIVLEPLNQCELEGLKFIQTEDGSDLFKLENSKKTSEISIQNIMENEGKVCYAVWTSKPFQCPRSSYFNVSYENLLIPIPDRETKKRRRCNVS